MHRVWGGQRPSGRWRSLPTPKPSLRPAAIGCSGRPMPRRDVNGRKASAAEAFNGEHGVQTTESAGIRQRRPDTERPGLVRHAIDIAFRIGRSAENTSELQSLMRISYVACCWKNYVWK